MFVCFVFVGGGGACVLVRFLACLIACLLVRVFGPLFVACA